MTNSLFSFVVPDSIPMTVLDHIVEEESKPYPATRAGALPKRVIKPHENESDRNAVLFFRSKIFAIVYSVFNLFTT